MANFREFLEKNTIFNEHPVSDKHWDQTWREKAACSKCFYIDLIKRSTGCSFNIVFFSNILKYSGLLPLSVFPRVLCVYTHQAGRTPALLQNWQSSEKSQKFKGKTQYLMNTLLFTNYMNLYNTHSLQRGSSKQSVLTQVAGSGDVNSAIEWIMSCGGVWPSHVRMMERR